MSDDEATEDIEEVWSDTDLSDDNDTNPPQEEYRESVAELQKAIQTLRDEQEKLINMNQTIRDDQTKRSQENKKVEQQNNTLVKRNKELQKRNLKLRQDREQMKFDGMATFWMFVRSRLPEFKAGTFDIEQLKRFEQLLDEFLKSRMPLKDKLRILSLRQVSSVQVEEGHRQNGCLDNIGEQLERLVNDNRAAQKERYAAKCERQRASDEAKKAHTRHNVLLKEARRVASEAKKRHDVLLNKALQDVHAAQEESDSTRQALQSANHRIQELVDALHALQAKYDALTTEHTALHTTHDNLQSAYDALLLQIQHDTQARYAKKLKQLESELEYAHNKFQMTMKKYGSSTSSRYKEWHRQIVADIEDRIRKHKATAPP
jgi:DNA repair exonuclease SbcCD ATPase subunit